MKIQFSKSKGNRTMKGSYKVKGRKHRIPIFGGLTIMGCLDNCWWCDELDKWCTLEEIGDRGFSSSNMNINNLKQAIRHIKKHKELPKGTRVSLRGNFVGFYIDFII